MDFGPHEVEVAISSLIMSEKLPSNLLQANVLAAKGDLALTADLISPLANLTHVMLCQQHHLISKAPPTRTIGHEEGQLRRKTHSQSRNSSGLLIIPEYQWE